MSAQKLALLSAFVIVAACATPQENPHYQHSTQYKGNPLNSPHGVTHTAPTQVAQGNNTTTQSYSSTAQQAADISTAPAGTVLARVVIPETSQAAQNTRQVIYEQDPQNSRYSAARYEATTYSSPSYSRIDASCVQQGLQNSADCAPTSVAINSQSAAITQPYTGSAQSLYVTSTTTRPLSPTEQALPDSYGTPGYEAMKNAQTQYSYEAPSTPQWEAVETAPQLGVAVPMTQPFASPLPAPAARPAQVQEANSPVIMQSQESFDRGTQREIREGDTVYSFSRQLCSSVEEIKAINSLDGTFNIRLGDTIRLPASKC